MSSLADEQTWLSTVSLMVLAAVATAAALIYTRAVMVPFVLSLFIYYLVSPLVELMQRRLRAPRSVAILVGLLFILFGLMMIVLLVTSSTRGLVESTPIYRERFQTLAEAVLSQLDRYGVDLGQQDVLDGLRQIPVLSLVRSTAGSVMGFISSGILMFVFVIFLLAGHNPKTRRQGIYLEIHARIRRYLIVKFITSAATGILVGAILTVLGLDLALTFGVLAFLLNFIPNVGSIVSTLLPLPLALVQFDTLLPVALVVLLPGAVQLGVGQLLEPKIMGAGLNLHPVVVLLALVFWGLIWGVVGMLLAAPITAVMKIILGRFETTRPIAEVLAGHLPADVPAGG